MIKMNFVFTFLCMGLMSCTLPPNENKEHHITVNFSNSSSPKLIIKDVIPLAMRDDALLDKFHDLRIVSQYYILGDRRKIVVFTKEGEIFSVIDAVGNGPEEAFSLNFFWADDKSILVMDMGKKRILEFDFKGNLLTTTGLKDSYAHFARFQNYYLFDDQYGSTDSGNVLLIADNEGQVIKDSIRLIGKGILYGGDKFQVHKEYALFLPGFNNTIYKIDKLGNISPYYTFDFGSHWANEEECNKFMENSTGDAFALWKYLKKNDMIGFLKFTDSPDWIVLNYEKKEQTFNWFYHKKSGTQHIVPYKDNDIENKKTSLLEYAVRETEKNNFVTIIPAFEYHQLTEMPKLPVSDEDNPVLVSFYLK